MNSYTDLIFTCCASFSGIEANLVAHRGKLENAANPKIRSEQEKHQDAALEYISQARDDSNFPPFGSEIFSVDIDFLYFLCHLHNLHPFAGGLFAITEVVVNDPLHVQLALVPLNDFLNFLQRDLYVRDEGYPAEPGCNQKTRANTLSNG